MITAEREVVIPAPLEHQEPIVASSARFKVVRAGRRGGKTVLAEGCAIVGHGPTDHSGKPIFKGIVHDLDVVWVARDYTQAGIMWHEFIRPRFKGVEGVRVNEADRTVTLENGGTLFVISAENIASARGMGKRLAGVIIEEAAWLDLQAALRDVILPALMDNEGWLLLISTTNAGPDGNPEKVVPSYFNRICSEIRAKERSDEWAEFHFTAQDNPKISARAFGTLVAEYAVGDPALDQEVYAKLLVGGVGLALEQVSADVHLVPRFKVPEHAGWAHFGGFDWGFNHPYVFGWFACNPDGDIWLIDSVWGRGEQPDQIHTKVSAAVPLKQLQYIAAGHDLWDDQAKARGLTGPTLFERFTGFGWLGLIKASTGRIAGLNNLRHYVQWKDAEGNKVREPRFRLMDTEGNRRVLKCLEGMQIDEKDVEDAAKVDADHAGKGGDDAYDMTRYGLMSRPIVVSASSQRARSEDRDRTNIDGRSLRNEPPAPQHVDRTWQQFDRESKAKQAAQQVGGWKAPRRGNVRVVKL